MKRMQIILISIWAILLFTNLNAGNTPKVGSTTNGGTFLYRESVEMYWNDWVAYPMTDRKSLPANGQVDIAVKGEGKNIEFSGILSINCENGQNYWIAANADLPEEHIPVAVNNNAVSLFCKGGASKRTTVNHASTKKQAYIPATPAYNGKSSSPLTCTDPALINIVTKQYEDNVFNLLLSKHFGMKTTYEDFQNILNSTETPRGRKELETVLNKAVEAYKKISVSIQLVRTVNRDNASSMVECVGTLDFGNGKTVDAGYKGQYTDNGEIYTVYKPLF